MRKLFLYFTILITFILALSDIVFAFSIEPSRSELSVPAGGRRGKTIIVDNTRSDTNLHLKAYIQDILFLPDGTNEFLEPGSTQWSCSKWVDIVPAEIDVPARSTGQVRLSVAAPRDATGGYYAIVFFESQPLYYEKGIGVNFRVGGLLSVTIPKTEIYKAKLADIVFTQPNAIAISIFNDSNVLIRPKGRVRIFNSSNKRIMQIDFNPERLGILPMTLRKFNVGLDKALSKGNYRLKAQIDYGARYLLMGEMEFNVD